MSLKENALLISLNITQWVGRKLDRRATKTVENAHSTDVKIGNFNKQLLPGAIELASIQSCAANLRVFFYENTLPWAHDGARIISSQNFVQFNNDFRARKQAFEHAVACFISVYPSLCTNAQQKLGDLFSVTDYPDENKLATKFNCILSVFPIPDISDFRVDLGDAQKKLFLDSMAKVESTALADCYARLFEVVKTASDRLKNPNAVFRDSLLENIQSIVTLLPRLNPIHDSRLEALTTEVGLLVNTISGDSIRASTETRETTATQLNDIAERLGAFMGVENDSL